MLISIYKQHDKSLPPTYFQQKFIDHKDPIPEGWTTNKKDIPKPSISKPENVEVYPNARSVNISTE